MVFSPSKRAAAQALFESATEQIRIGFVNVTEFEQSKYTAEKKTEFIEILKALELAYFAVSKRICAETPLKHDLWCRFETDVDEPLIKLHHEVDDFFVKCKVTEEMKTKDAHMPLNAP